jgi:hypothetical protein
MPTVAHPPQADSSPAYVLFETVAEWLDKQTQLAYDDRTVTVLEAVKMTSPLHPFAWSDLGKQMLFGIPYARISETEWVDARLLSVKEST